MEWEGVGALEDGLEQGLMGPEAEGIEETEVELDERDGKRRERYRSVKDLAAEDGPRKSCDTQRLLRHALSVSSPGDVT